MIFELLGSDSTRTGLQRKCLTAAFLLKQPVSRTNQTKHIYIFIYLLEAVQGRSFVSSGVFPGCNTQLLPLCLHTRNPADLSSHCG